MKIVLLGASGVAGRAGLSAFLQAGHTVRAHARSREAARRLESFDTEVQVLDLDEPGALATVLAGVDAVVDVRVAIPPASKAAMPGAWREYVRLRDSARNNLVDAAIDQGVSRIIVDTITAVYEDGGDDWLDEDSPADAPGALAANIATDRHLARFRAHQGVGVNLRFGAFYGAVDVFSAETVAAARRGKALIIGRPEAWTSAVHTDDVGSALEVALEAPDGVYNVVDDEPLRRRELIQLLAAEAGRETLKPFPLWMSKVASAPVRAQARSQRVSNEKFTKVGWSPTVGSRRTGWPQVFADHVGEPEVQPGKGAASD